MAQEQRIKRITIKHTTERGATIHTFTEPAAPWAVRNTDEKLRTLESRVRQIFYRARDDLVMKQMEFLEKHQKRVERRQAEVAAGLLSQNDFNAWMRGQIFQSRQWELKRGQLARMLRDLDQKAVALINEGRMEIFADNADHMLFQIERGRGVSTPFGLFNAEAVARLLRDDPAMLPMGKLDDEKEYRFFNEAIQNAVIQGILQGETLDEIALRVAEDTGEKAAASLRRHARTAYTGAQNAGALYSMRRARDELGIKLKKRWMATLDSYTRAAHANLDGQVRDIDEPFDSLLGQIMYPGDPDADPKNVWNCRCYLDEFYPDYDNTMARYDDEGDFVGDITYEQWRRMKAA